MVVVVVMMVALVVVVVVVVVIVVVVAVVVVMVVYHEKTRLNQCSGWSFNDRVMYLRPSAHDLVMTEGGGRSGVREEGILER